MVSAGLQIHNEEPIPNPPGNNQAGPYFLNLKRWGHYPIRISAWLAMIIAFSSFRGKSPSGKVGSRETIISTSVPPSSPRKGVGRSSSEPILLLMHTGEQNRPELGRRQRGMPEGADGNVAALNECPNTNVADSYMAARAG